MNESPAEPRRRFSAVHLLAALLALFISSPFIQDLPHGRLIEGVLFTAVIFSGLFAVAGRMLLLGGSLLAGLALVGQWVSALWPAGPVGSWYLVPALVFLGFVVQRLMAFVLQAPDVSTETLCASIAGFLMIGLMWALGYALLARLDPGSFTVTPAGEKLDGFNAFYFSFVTLSTIGYGDITPVSRVARMLAVVEAITDVLCRSPRCPARFHPFLQDRQISDSRPILHKPDSRRGGALVGIRFRVGSRIPKS